MKKAGNFFYYKLKKIETKSKRKKIFLWNSRQKRTDPKWTSNKMGNAKKGHNI